MAINIKTIISNKSKGLPVFFLLTYFDKFLSFAMPLGVLFFIKDKFLYSYIEVIFSYAAIAVTLVELGLSNYLFFGYKIASDKIYFLVEAQKNFRFLILVYTLLAVAVLIAVRSYNEGFFYLFLYVSIRTLFTYYINFYSNIFRLEDNPSKIYLITTIVNLSSFLLIIAAFFLKKSELLIYFFVPPLVLLLINCVQFVIFEIKNFRLSSFISFLKPAMKFSWPIILNILFMNFMNNYAKIYAFKYLQVEETVQISYIMRVGLIVQLTHTSFASFFSKALFMDESHSFNKKIFAKYTIALLSATLLVGLIIFISNNYLNISLSIPLNISTLLFIFYIVGWCYIGYLEIYFSIKNANKYVLIFSIISSVIYVALLRIFDNIDIFKLSLFMAITVLLNLFMVIGGLVRLKIFSTV